MTDPSKEVFDNYLSGHERNVQGRDKVKLDEIIKFKLNRLPVWAHDANKDAKILEIGCGTGTVLNLLHQLGFKLLTGIDVSAQMLASAREKLPPEVDLQCIDVQDFFTQKENESFDFIMAAHVLEHIPREQTIPVLKEAFRTLKHGGYLNLKVPNAACLLSGRTCFCDFTHVVHFNELSLAQVLEIAGFDASNINIIQHRPKLFWSNSHPHRAAFRLLNRLRWHLNDILHKSVVVLHDFPRLQCTEWELEVLVRK